MSWRRDSISGISGNDASRFPMMRRPRANDYTNLPPTMTYVGDLEVFRDETVPYVGNRRKAGVPVEFVVFEGCFHGFDIFVPQARVSKEATAFTMRCFANALDNHVAPQAS